jgi:2-oxoglutarate dehydrogenase E2 component (dihydrolipoamide succinyltransferase)
VFAADGAITSRSVAVIGLAYDHRFVNGSVAVAFLKAIKAGLESAGARGEEVRVDAGER